MAAKKSFWETHWQSLAAVGFGLVFVVVMLIIAIFIPHPSPFQLLVFRVVLSLAAAGIGAIIPGFLRVNVKTWVRAGGAMALFIVVYFWNPPALIVNDVGANGGGEGFPSGEPPRDESEHSALSYEDVIDDIRQIGRKPALAKYGDTFFKKWKCRIVKPLESSVTGEHAVRVVPASMSIDDVPKHETATCYFPTEYVPRLPVLQPGDVKEISGVLKNISNLGLRLVNCRFSQVE